MPQRSGPKIWAFVFVVLLLGVVGSVSYLGWRQSVPGVQAVATPPRFLGQKTAFTVVVEARRGNVAQVEVRVVQNGKSTTVAKQEGGRVGRLEVPIAVESATLGLREGAATVESVPEAMDALVRYYRLVAGEHPDWDEYRAALPRTLAEVRSGDEAREGLSAFLEKRKPKWTE